MFSPVWIIEYYLLASECTFFADKCGYICLVKVLIVILTGKAMVAYQKLLRIIYWNRYSITNFTGQYSFEIVFIEFLSSD